jgi:hypothetical protein
MLAPERAEACAQLLGDVFQEVTANLGDPGLVQALLEVLRPVPARVVQELDWPAESITGQTPRTTLWIFP